MQRQGSNPLFLFFVQTPIIGLNYMMTLCLGLGVLFSEDKSFTVAKKIISMIWLIAIDVLIVQAIVA